MKAEFLIVGDQAVSVQFDKEISLKNNARVRSLHQRLLENPIDGIEEMVQTYAALMIYYRPEVIRYGELVKKLQLVVDSLRIDETVKEDKRIITEIPVLYGGELGEDLEYCAGLEGKTPEEIIRIHSESLYYIYMLGFAPGHPYSARFENPFSFQRRETARVKIPAGSIVVQLNLSDIIPFEQPCGWNIIGNTPVKVSDFRKEQPFALKAGEWIRHVPISQEEYARIKKQVDKGTYVFKRYEEVVKE